jgi:multidrug efflux pump subunit AcrB
MARLRMAAMSDLDPDINDAELSKLNPMTRVVNRFMRGDVTLILVLVSLIVGFAALMLTAREEEPQIVVPMADVMIQAPGLSAEEVERQVTERLEKLLYQIDGVQYVYSMSQPGQSMVTVRFYVGEDREDALTKLFSKINSEVDQIPPSVTGWVVKPIEIDDVPIVTVSLWSEDIETYGDFELRRLAEELQQQLQGIKDTNRVQVVGGRPRRVLVNLDASRMAAYQTSPLQIAQALQQANVRIRSGNFDQQDQQFLVESGDVITNVESLQRLVIHVVNDRPVMLSNVAEVIDGPAEPESYSWMGFGQADPDGHLVDSVYPAVHLAVAKRKGANAVWVANQVHTRMSDLSGQYLPKGVHYRITRDYGQTANAKVNELVQGLMVAILTVVGLIGLTIGWRAALVIALAIPVCYSLTLMINYLVGYSINRVTMFALILSLGLLVDDPITDIENIARYFSTKRLKPRLSTLLAVQEVRPALIMSTLAIIASFLPLAFITDMMGPYMAPMALNVPLTVTISTLVAFTVTPWLGMMAFRGLRRKSDVPGQSEVDDRGGDEDEASEQVIHGSPLFRLAAPVFDFLLQSPWRAVGALLAVAGLLAVVCILPLLRQIPLKILPYDNKNEFQIVIDMPEGTTLERTDLVARRIGDFLGGLSEVRDYQVFVGLSSPMDFNGMVRHYFLRRLPHQADIRVNLVDKSDRRQQSHEIILRIRDDLERLGQELGANLKIVEVPPGPPVLSTITAEVYAPADASYDQLLQVAELVEERLRLEPGIVDVDSSQQADQLLYRFVVDQPKAALSGIYPEHVAQTLRAALGGLPVTQMRAPGEINPLWIELRLPRIQRSSIEQLRQIYVRGESGQMVQLSELGRFIELLEDKTIYHKNLRRVAFVYGEIAGVPPANAIIDTQWDRQDDGPAQIGGVMDETNIPAVPAEIRPLAGRTWLSPGSNIPWRIPPGFDVVWTGEGEWKITLDVFRDLGIAFGAALVGIFLLLMFQTGSRVLPLLIMLAIPLTMIGIMPGFWLLNLMGTTEIAGHPNPVFFTATAMIGMIALSGIVVRNSIVLIDFINAALARGLPLKTAIVQSVVVRTRPILLTAGTTLLGNWVITLDPVFSGLAWAIIFGIFASTLFTLLVIPIAFWLLYRGSHA